MVIEVPASIGQRLLAMIGHYRAGHGALNCPLLCRLRGPLEIAALQAALDGLTEAHESLRTTFTGRGPALRQVVHPPRPLPLTVVDSCDDAAVNAELSRPIDVASWPARATLWRAGPADHTLCLNLHHLVTDAWSTGILFAELRLRYARALGRPANLTAPSWQYRDFAEWQRDLCDGPDLDRHRDYWRDRLSGLRVPRLPYREPPPGATPGMVTADLPSYVVDGLREIARDCGTTLFTVALALYYAVLRQACGQDDLPVASLFANRARPESRGTVGFLANMVVLRTRLDESMRFPDLVRATHATVAGALAYQEHPYQTLPLEATTSPGGGRVDDVVFQMMAELDFTASAAGLEFELLVPDGIGSRFGVELAIAPRGRGLRAVLFYTPRLDDDTAARLLSGYVSAATAVARDDGAPVAQLGT